MEDKAILSSSDWLTDRHMSAANSILKMQFPGINGLQETTGIPHYSDSQDKWLVNKQFQKQAAPSAQIHFNGSNHWVFTCQRNEGNEVLYADSLSSKNAPNSNVQIQIAQIYGRSQSNLLVHVPKVQQQPNSYDCGIFAIAHAVEFCLNPKTYSGKQNFDFSCMRTHLTTCLENEKFEPFPKESSRLRNVKIDITKNIRTVEISCQCGLPDFLDDMVGCENRKCRKWYHLRCVGVSKGQECSWVCEKCMKEHVFSVK